MIQRIGVRSVALAGAVALSALALMLWAGSASAANCTITGTNGDDVLMGTPGNDVICGLGGDDQLSGEAGNDTLDGGNGADVMSGGAGTDKSTYNKRTAAVTVTIDDVANDGTTNTDSTTGTGEAQDNVQTDVENVVGGSGADSLSGSDSANLLVGGPGGDTISGGAGNDKFKSDGGNDTLNGDAGNDTLDGGPGTDEINGGSGTADKASYNARKAPVTVTLDDLANDGEAGENDNVHTDVENLVGGDGADSLSGDDSANNIRGEPGDDNIVGGSGADVINGGKGSDTADYSARSASQVVNVTTDGVANDGTTDIDSLTGIGTRKDNVQATTENVTGGAADDDIRAKLNGVASNLQGLAGDDFLQSDETDVLDTTDGGNGFDTCKKDAGDAEISCETTFPGFQMASCDYAGNHVDDRQITGLGFKPDLVMVKSDDGAGQAQVLTSTMTDPVNNTKALDGATALSQDLIQSLDSDGFTIGTKTDVNKTGSTYHCVAFKAAAGHMTLGTYTGDDSAGQSISGLGFSPEYVMVLPEQAKDATQRMAGMTRAFKFAADTGNTDWITSLDADGFSVGSQQEVNDKKKVYHYVAWNEVKTEMKTSSYTGTGASHSISGVGFQPGFMMVHANDTVTGRPGAMRSSALLGSESQVFSAGAGGVNETTGITALQADGFQLGASASVNASGPTYHYVAFQG